MLTLLSWITDPEKDYDVYWRETEWQKVKTGWLYPIFSIKEQNFETLESLFRNCFNRQFSFDVCFYRISVPLVFRSLQYLIKSIIGLAQPLSGHFRLWWPFANSNSLFDVGSEV